MKSLKFLIPLLLFGALAVLLTVGLSRDPREVPSPLIGKPAPNFALPLLDSPQTVVKREDLLGKVWMLNVWASWCATCQQEHPQLVAFARSKRVPVYGLNIKDKRTAAQDWLARLGNPYEANFFDADGKVSIDWGVYGAPETFIIDKQGIVRFKHIGALTPEVLRERIEPLLKALDA